MESAHAGVILDSCVLIAGERRAYTVWEILERVQSVRGDCFGEALASIGDSTSIAAAS